MKSHLKPNRSLEFYRNKQKLSSLYFTSLLVGSCVAFYLFIFNFENYRDTMLISGTVLWLSPIIFGYYGFIAQWLYSNFQEKRFRKPKDLLLSISEKLPKLIIRPLFNICLLYTSPSPRD